jgi:hypothetical protein
MRRIEMTYEERLAQAKAYTKAHKVQATASGQKFPRGTLVHVQKEMPESMSHFESDFDAIVEYSYAQKFGGGEAGQSGHVYSLIQLENGVPVNSIAWYDEDLLTLVDARTELGEEILRGWASEYGE